MKAELYPIPEVPSGKLAIMPRPRAGDWLSDEIASWKRDGVNLVVSLLEDEEIEELGLDAEADECAKAGVAYLRHPISDRGLPESRQRFAEFVDELVRELKRGRSIAIHCRIGVGRSALVAACVLVAMGRPLSYVWTTIQKARGMSVPDTDEQREWVAKFSPLAH